MTAAPESAAASLPVRPGEDPWTEDELAEVRTQLESDLAELRAETDHASAAIAGLLGDAVTEAGDDEADASSKLFEREHELAISNNARELLSQTEHALARIATGTYGTCESCGNAIGKARLLAFPRATLCVTCKQRQERR
jgi:RNA polymerase-binding protein DksA